MKTYTIGTSWKRLLAVSSVLGVLLTGYSASTTANAASSEPGPGACIAPCFSKAGNAGYICVCPAPV